MTQAARIDKLENDLATTVWLLAEVSFKHNQVASLIALSLMQQVQQQQASQFLAGMT